jgi:hypothetical protein
LAQLQASNATSSAGEDPGTDADAIRDARVLWDNPLQSMAYLALGVLERRVDPSFPPCALAGGARIATTVGAYSVFGILVDRARVLCDGSTERL